MKHVIRFADWQQFGFREFEFAKDMPVSTGDFRYAMTGRSRYISPFTLRIDEFLSGFKQPSQLHLE